MLGNAVGVMCDEGLALFEFEFPSGLRLKPPVFTGNTLTLSWNGGPGIKLQRAESPANANGQDVAGSVGVSQIELRRTDSTAFFQLIQP